MFIGSSGQLIQGNSADRAGSADQERPLRVSWRICGEGETRWLRGWSLALLPARRNADVGQAEEAFDARPLAEVVALDAMADVLQDVSQDKGADAPVPLVPRQGEQQDDAGDG